MKLRALVLFVLASSAVSAPGFAQANRGLAPVQPDELNAFVGTTLYGRAWSRLGIVSKVDRGRGTVMVHARNGEVATLPVSLLGRAGFLLRAPAVWGADIARASYGGKSTVPLRGEVTVTEDAASPSSVQ